jgi:Subtilase family
MTKRNFLLAKGERLTKDVIIKTGGQPKEAPYTFDEARARLKPMLADVAHRLDTLPAAACPDDSAVASVTLNPEYVAKSYFPSNLLRSVGLTSVGSRPKRVTPQKRSRCREPEETVTTEMFLMGTRAAFRDWSQEIGQWRSTHSGANQLPTIEAVTAPAPSDKLIHVERADDDMAVFEVVLHTDEQRGEDFFVPKFKEYLETLGLAPPLQRRFYAGGLCFLELEAPRDLIEDVAVFSLVRAIRPMPALRMLRPPIRTAGVSNDVAILPTKRPVDPKLRSVIFDGGLPEGHPLTKWATPIDAPGVGPANDELLGHGVGVTSAFLFGHLRANKDAPRPFGPVHHYRVIDTIPGQNPYELYEVLDRIESVLTTSKYDFINLSLGPELPIDDDEVHAWTAVLDDHFSHGECLAAVAVGNGGEGDVAIAANRVQVPADCVNALAVGAADTPGADWARASYSSVGPGRSPGLIKPDLVAFGGSTPRPFLVLSHDNAPKLEPTGGTSFSAPSVIRMGTGVRAHFGDVLNPLALRALLIHCVEPADIPHAEIGWGRLAADLEDIVVCPDDTIRVVYQGTVSASKYIRAPIPVPDIPFKGMVTVKATLCYATKVDPHHPGNYTRAGLEVYFRPNEKAFKDDKAEHALTKSFFGKSRPHLTEDELRHDSWKWENCQHAQHSYRGHSLNAAVFDIHYNARFEGRNDTRSQKLKYALVVSVTAKRMPDLYDRVVRRYRTQLEALRPVIEIPVRVATDENEGSP